MNTPMHSRLSSSAPPLLIQNNLEGRKRPSSPISLYLMVNLEYEVLSSSPIGFYLKVDLEYDQLSSSSIILYLKVDLEYHVLSSSPISLYLKVDLGYEVFSSDLEYARVVPWKTKMMWIFSQKPVLLWMLRSVILPYQYDATLACWQIT